MRWLLHMGSLLLSVAAANLLCLEPLLAQGSQGIILHHAAHILIGRNIFHNGIRNGLNQEDIRLFSFID